MDPAGRRVLVLGLGREGISLARYLVERGARVTVTDSAPARRLEDAVEALRGLPIDLALGGHRPDTVRAADTVFVSPGVPESNPVYRAAVESGRSLESMTTLFFSLCPAPIVGVTGSSGKTTTTALIGHILRESGCDVVVGGNIGDPMLDLLPRIKAETLVVLELSSFQLDLLRQSPHIAVVTNITPNHLDRHTTMATYIAAKRHIVEHQRPDGVAVLNARDAEVARFAASTPGQVRWFGGADSDATVHQGALAITRRSGERVEVVAVLPRGDLPLIGGHNVENALAAMAATDVLSIPPADMAAAMRTFQPIPHRLQTVAVRDGVTYIDDSIATTPARALVALDAITEPIVLIAGGRDKHLPWDTFARAAARRLKALLLVGEAAELIDAAVRPEVGRNSKLKPCMIRRCNSLEDAVTQAYALTDPGDAVLLAPGCASYDMFADFHHRGQAFTRAVAALDAS